MPRFSLSSAVTGALISLLVTKGAAQSFVPIANSAQEMYISSNGVTIAGNEGAAMAGNGAWLWRTDLQQFWESPVSNVYVLSGSGLVSAGDTDSNSSTFYYPFGNSEDQLGFIPQAMSANGQILFGYQGAGSTVNVWTPSGGAKTIFQTSNQEYPWTCSADGSWLFGITVTNNPIEAWVYNAGAAKAIGAFHPYQCSIDGQVVVGVSSSNSAVIDAWSPTQASHVILPGEAYTVGDMPVSITADGSTIWGNYVDSNGLPHAYTWTAGLFNDLGPNSSFLVERGQRGSTRFPGTWEDPQAHSHLGFYETGGKGWVDIQTALTNSHQDLSGWSNLQIQAISDDGTKMCGDGTGPAGSQAFYIDYPADYTLVSGVTPASLSVTGGSATSLQVQLSRNAPPGGAVVSLFSNNSNVQVASTATVPAGASSVTVPETTHAVSSGQTVLITAGYNGYAVQNQFNIVPASIQSYSVAPTTVYGGETTVGTVTLNGNAGPSGTTVSLLGGNGSVHPPSTVTIPSGQSQVSFNVTTTNVASTVTAQLSASLAGIIRTASLTLTPNPITYFYASPNYILGGAPTTGYVEVSTAAGSSGDFIALSTSTPGVTVPASVTIASGQKIATFAITTSAVTANTTVQLTATFGQYVSHGTFTLYVIDFQNSDFESPVIKANSWEGPPPNGFVWTGPSRGFGVANGNTPWASGAASGNQYVYMQSANDDGYTQGTCQQTVNGLIVGRSYEVSFYLQSRPETGGSPVTLTANGTQIFGPTMPAHSGSWTQYTSSSFVANSTSCTFVFSVGVPPSDSDQSSLLDEVHLITLPASPSAVGK